MKEELYDFTERCAHLRTFSDRNGTVECLECKATLCDMSGANDDE